MILFVAVTELVGLCDDPRLHRSLAETKVPQRSQREPPLLKKWTINPTSYITVGWMGTNSIAFERMKLYVFYLVAPVVAVAHDDADTLRVTEGFLVVPAEAVLVEGGNRRAGRESILSVSFQIIK